MPINASNALTLAHQLRVYTAEAASFSDMMDVVYVAQMIQKFLGYVDQIKEVRFNLTSGVPGNQSPFAQASCAPASRPQTLLLPSVTLCPLPAGGSDGGHGQQSDAGG